MPLREMDLERVRLAAVMTRGPATVDEDAPVSDAAAEMAAGGFRHVPVVSDGGRLVGMISERDLRARLGTDPRGFAESWSDAFAERAGAAMTPDPISLSPEATLGQALAVFADDRVGAIPIVDATDRVVGIVSYVDLLRSIRELSMRRALVQASAEREAAERVVRKRGTGRHHPAHGRRPHHGAVARVQH